MIGDILEHLGFAEALEQLLGEKRIQMLMMITTYAIVNSTRAFSALISSPLLFKTKKGENGFLGCEFLWSFSK
ncbi:MAG: hypothetical protein ABR909_10120 [Candidatus Bathyarchaeia archaeon]